MKLISELEREVHALVMIKRKANIKIAAVVIIAGIILVVSQFILQI